MVPNLTLVHRRRERGMEEGGAVATARPTLQPLYAFEKNRVILGNFGNATGITAGEAKTSCND